jgi:hypothetical protein
MLFFSLLLVLLRFHGELNEQHCTGRYITCLMNYTTICHAATLPRGIFPYHLPALIPGLPHGRFGARTHWSSGFAANKRSPLLAYCVEKLGSRAGRKRKIGNSTVQNGHYGTNVGQCDCRRHQKFVRKVAVRLFQHNRPIMAVQCTAGVEHDARDKPARSSFSLWHTFKPRPVNVI